MLYIAQAFLVDSVGEFLSGKFFNSKHYTNGQVITVLVILLAAFIVAKIVQRLLKIKTEKLGDEEADKRLELRNKLFNVLDEPIIILVYLAAIMIAVAVLDPPWAGKYVKKIVSALIAVDVTWLLFRLIDYGVMLLTEKYREREQKMAVSLMPMVRLTSKIFISLLAFVLIVQNLGYSVSGLIAGLGIGGAAIALASQDTLSGIFGSLVIFLDRPFMVGDFIKVGGIIGSVEDVEFRSTRIRTVNRTLVSIPNNKIVNDTIENFTKRPQIRITTNLGAMYNSSPDQMRSLLKRLREVIYEHPMTEKEPIHVFFSDFADSSLSIYLHFYVASPDWETFLRVREELYLSFMDAFQENGVGFAFPSRSIYIEQSGQKKADKPSPEAA